MAPVALYKTPINKILVGGLSVVAMYGPVAGGLIVNPQYDQAIAEPEVLFVDITGPAALQETATTVPIQPGQYFTVPPGQTTNVWVNAETTGHKFSGIVYQPPTPYPPAPQPGPFPPSGPTTLTALGGMAAYLYQEYADDDDLQAFFAAYNMLAQIYVGWFATVGLPVYTNPQISGALLDWVAEGLYGMLRPSLSSGANRDLGPLNTYGPNVLPLNARKRIGPANVTLTTDDVFRRIMTWNFYKGDGNVFNARWLKRRVMRFLTGTDGTAPNIDQTYAVSVIFGAGGFVTIRIAIGQRTVSGGALCNRFGPNQRVPLNALFTNYVPPLVPNPFPLESVLKEALESGVLIVPFQYQVAVII